MTEEFFNNFQKLKNEAAPAREFMEAFDKVNFYTYGFRNYLKYLPQYNTVFDNLDVPLNKFSNSLGQASERLSNALFNFLWTHDVQSFYVKSVEALTDHKLDIVTKAAQEILGDPESEFNKSLLKLIRYWLDYGSAILIMLPTEDGKLLFKTHSPLTAHFNVNERNQLKNVFIAHREKGEKEQDEIVTEFYTIEKEGMKEEFVLYRVNENKRTYEEILRSPNRFFFLSRLNDNESSHPYGIGKAMNILGDVISENSAINLLYLEAAYAMNPTLVMNDQAILGKNKIRREVGNVIAVNNGDQDIQKVISTLPRLENVLTAISLPIQQAENSIQKEYLIDQLFSQEVRSDTTATEIQSRESNKLSVIKPMAEIIYTDMLTPLITTIVYNLPYEAVPVQEFAVVYNSSSSRIGELMRMQDYLSFIQICGQFGQTDPALISLINFEELLRKFAAAYNIDTSLIRTPQELEQIRQQIAMAAAMQQQQDS